MFRKIFIFVSFIVQFASTQDASSRKKRTLIVPPTSPTRHQLISGIGIPLNLEYEAITLGLVLKAQYYLPTDIRDGVLWDYFPGILANFTPLYPTLNDWQKFPLPGKRRRREVMLDKYTGQKYEKYVGEVNEVGNEELKESAEDRDEEYNFDDTFEDAFPEDGRLALKENLTPASDEELADTSGTRWLMYDGLGRLLTSKGLQGRPCVLRGICEAAETKLTHESGLLGELLHIVFTPSTSYDPITNKDHYDYIKAEQLGEAGEPCAEIFNECKNSLMDIFSQVYDSKLFKFNN